MFCRLFTVANVCRALNHVRMCRTIANISRFTRRYSNVLDVKRMCARQHKQFESLCSFHRTSFYFQNVPTVFPNEFFDSSADAKALRMAMKHFFTENWQIINIACRRSDKQRQVWFYISKIYDQFAQIINNKKNQFYVGHSTCLLRSIRSRLDRRYSFKNKWKLQ